MKRGFVVAVAGAAVLVAGLSGCSKDEKKSESSSSSSSAASSASSAVSATSGTATASAGAGSAKVTIDGQPQTINGQVVCATAGGNYNIAIGEAATGIAATAIFCLIFAWNEYAFAVLLTSGEAQTAPPFIPIIIGEGGQDWPAVAAGTTLFLIPILVFTVLLRKHLLRGITFGAVRK